MTAAPPPQRGSSHSEELERIIREPFGPLNADHGDIVEPMRQHLSDVVNKGRNKVLERSGGPSNFKPLGEDGKPAKDAASLDGRVTKKKISPDDQSSVPSIFSLGVAKTKVLIDRYIRKKDEDEIDTSKLEQIIELRKEKNEQNTESLSMTYRLKSGQDPFGKNWALKLKGVIDNLKGGDSPCPEWSFVMGGQTAKFSLDLPRFVARKAKDFDPGAHQSGSEEKKKAEKKMKGLINSYIDDLEKDEKNPLFRERLEALKKAAFEQLEEDFKVPPLNAVDDPAEKRKLHESLKTKLGEEISLSCFKELMDLSPHECTQGLANKLAEELEKTVQDELSRPARMMDGAAKKDKPLHFKKMIDEGFKGKLGDEVRSFLQSQLASKIPEVGAVHSAGRPFVEARIAELANNKNNIDRAVVASRAQRGGLGRAQ